MELHNLKKSKGTKKPQKRVGRGIGSGKGAHTTGRGHKGQKSRSGYNLPVGFEGGQVPMFKKLPQIGGFKNPRARKIVIVTLDKFNVFKDGTTVTPEDLVKMGVLTKISRGTQVKVLGTGELDKKIEFQGFLFSRSAKESLEKAGAKIS